MFPLKFFKHTEKHEGEYKHTSTICSFCRICFKILTFKNYIMVEAPYISPTLLWFLLSVHLILRLIIPLGALILTLHISLHQGRLLSLQVTHWMVPAVPIPFKLCFGVYLCGYRQFYCSYDNCSVCSLLSEKSILLLTDICFFQLFANTNNTKMSICLLLCISKVYN